ncbi:MAG: hypothetical protein GY941_19545 [Planctomycetes bacterium]|nr:hypothetical protein [Planctomycetota bacterium]
MYEFNNFDYDSDTKSDNTVDFNDLLFESETSVMNATEIRKMESAESELASMEEDGDLTMTSLAILALIISLLALYILYWFCCSASSKGYRQSSQFVSGGYYEDDIDDYQRKSPYYHERINGGYALSNGGNDSSGNSDTAAYGKSDIIGEDGHHCGVWQEWYHRRGWSPLLSMITGQKRVWRVWQSGMIVLVGCMCLDFRFGY